MGKKETNKKTKTQIKSEIGQTDNNKVSSSNKNPQMGKMPGDDIEKESSNYHITKCEALVKRYCDVYPNEIEFHVTSDYQVFLCGDKCLAQNHQRAQKSGELVTIKIK